MKKLTLFFTITLMSFASFAQDATSDEQLRAELIDLLAVEMCDCATKKGNVDELTQKELAMCLVPGLGKYSEYFEKLGIDFGDGVAMNALGEQIGLKAAVQCPEIFANFIEDELDTINEEEELAEEEEEVVFYKGEVKRIEVADFVTLYIKYEGKTKKILWMSEVETSVDIYNGFDQLLSKQVEFSCYDATLFDLKINEYRDFQILETLEIIE